MRREHIHGHIHGHSGDDKDAIEFRTQLRGFLENRCRGRVNALKLKELGRILMRSRRELQRAVAGLLDEGVPVGTSKTFPHGVYLITDETECAAAANQLIHTAVSELKRAAKLKKIPLGDLYRQLDLGFVPAVPQQGTARA